MYNNLILFVFNLILFWLAWLECKYTKILNRYTDGFNCLEENSTEHPRFFYLKLIWLSYTQSQNSLHLLFVYGKMKEENFKSYDISSSHLSSN